MLAMLLGLLGLRVPSILLCALEEGWFLCCDERGSGPAVFCSFLRLLLLLP